MKPYGLGRLARVTVGNMQENRRFIKALKKLVT